MQSELSPVFGILKNPSLVDFPGAMAGVMFTAGCNFRCGFCHNAELLGAYRPGMGWEQLQHACRRWRDNWVQAVVITGGEPTMAQDLALLIERLHQWGFRVKLDTNGSRPDLLRDLAGAVEYIAMDVKCALVRYPKFVHYPHPEHIVRSIEIIRAAARDYEFRTTIIPGFHSDEELREIGRSLRGARRWALQAFVPRDSLPDPRFRNIPRTSPERLEQAGKLAAEFAEEILLRGA